MATECDCNSDSGSASDDSSSIIELYCDLCGTDLERDWPDLSLDPEDIRDHDEDVWRWAAEQGCPFCNIVISVYDDAVDQHGCSIPLKYKVCDEGFKVCLRPNGSSGQYLLALESVYIPLLVGPEVPNKGHWGIVTVHLDEPDAFNINLQPFFEIPKHAGSAPSLKYARDWLTTCQNDHPDCSLSLSREDDLLSIPDASIRILKICEDTLRLTPAELCGTLPPFVALSHCWGSSPTLKTRLANIKTFQTTGIPLESLPATFADAIKTTSSLGFSYIWIDSLCIIQDCKNDWAEQSNLMSFVYGNADLVLAASSASSAGDGFLGERTSYRESSLEIRCVGDNTRTLALRYRLLQPKQLAPMLDPLDRRAWAFQERLLARRYLAFGSHDTSWACMTSSDCECGWWRIESPRQTGIMNIKKVIRDSTDDELGACWRGKALRKYTRRSLTFSSDNLVALSAIASIFHARLGTNYYAGIWQGDLIPGLLWNSGGSPRDNYGLGHSAPSWSWASLAEMPSNIYDLGERPKRVKYLAEVIEISTTPLTVNQFGPVRSGFIKVLGRVWRAEIAPYKHGQRLEAKVKGHFEARFSLLMDTSLIITETLLPDGAKERSVRRVRREEVQDEFYLGNSQDGETSNVFLVALIHEEDNGWGVEALQGLILGRSPKDPTKFERVGKFDAYGLTAADPNRQNEDGMEENDEQEIVIV